MTRGNFMSDMLKYVFGVKYIEFSKIKNSLVEYTKGGSFCKDCTYTSVYKNRLKEIFGNLLDEKFTEICIKKNKYSRPVPVDEYRERTKNFIFELKGYESLNTEIFETIKENMTVAMISRICNDIIIEEIFNIDGKKSCKERRNDNFDDSISNICKSVLVFIKNELPELTARKYKKDFFNFLTEQYPVFSELELDEDNEIVCSHLMKKEKELKNIYSTFKVIEDFTLRVEFIDNCKIYHGELAKFGDKNNMQEDDFIDLKDMLESLCYTSQNYNSFLKKDITEFKNTAVRIYNLLYGENHPEYKGVISIAAWNAHEYFIEYLFNLDFVLKLYK